MKSKKFFLRHKSAQSKELFYYGLDRGEAQQASLCVIKENSKNDTGFLPAPIKFYKLKEEELSDRQAVKNLSYLINESHRFETKESPAFDLTVAKLIGGKIVENGDIFTYLKFKEFCAKRELFNNRGQITDRKIFVRDQKLYVKISNREKTENKDVYHFREEFKKILPIEHIQDKLQKYLDHLNKPQSLFITVDKINHLRAALSANIAGILAFLHRQNGGLLIFEKGQKQKQQSIQKNKKEESIAGSLEWALYRKFQTEGLAPPGLKAVDLLLTGENSLTNFGLIYFVDPKNTSKMCPQCDHTDHGDFRERKKAGWFKCEKCGFNTKQPSGPLCFLDDTDKLAGFNICRKGRKAFKIGINQR